jgi:hypothetical protein
MQAVVAVAQTALVRKEILAVMAAAAEAAALTDRLARLARPTLAVVAVEVVNGTAVGQMDLLAVRALLSSRTQARLAIWRQLMLASPIR